jgi:hypothetical protein
VMNRAHAKAAVPAVQGCDPLFRHGETRVPDQ